MDELLFTKCLRYRGTMVYDTFYGHDGGAFRFHHYVPQDERGYNEECHRKNREQYNRDYRNWRDQHPGHSRQFPKEEERRK